MRNVLLSDCFFSIFYSFELDKGEGEVFFLFQVDTNDFSKLFEAIFEIVLGGLDGEWDTA